ncbi:MAG TPA: FMN-binding protein, partial [Blastocatellia bacterium]|nr:FMN-binding protein [Blastocatellia bacterium]
GPFGPFDWTQERVYLSEEKALKLVFPKSQQIQREEQRLNDEQTRSVEHRLGVRLASSEQVVWRGTTDGGTDGYAMILHEIGKERLITFIVGIAPDFKVQRIALMVFRESKGWEVEDPRFTAQFRGKTSQNRLQIGSDIIGITGATLSSRAFCRGAKKALVICETLYKH